MFFKILIAIYAIFVALQASYISRQQDYGAFDVKLLSYTADVNQKFRDTVEINYKLEEFPNGTVTVWYFFLIKKHLGVVGLKLRVYKFNDAIRKFIPSFNMAMDNICQKQLAKEFLTLIPELNEDCNVNPGVYNFTISDFNAFVHLFSTGKFFYGKYMVLTDVYIGKTGRVVRFNVTSLVSPK